MLGLPLVEEKCLAWMECRLLPATSAQENTIRYLANGICSGRRTSIFGGRWQFDDDKLNDCCII